MDTILNQSQPLPTDLLYMDAALNLAREAACRGEVPVGALVVERSGDVLGSASNESVARRDATAHAEMLALRMAQERFGDWRLGHCTLFVTKEPCAMCAGAALLTRVERIVFGLSDPKAGALGGAFNVMQVPGLNHRCEIVPGVRREETHAALKEFFTTRRQESIAQRKSRKAISDRPAESIKDPLQPLP